MANYNDYLEYLKHIDNTTEQEIKTKINGLNDEISNLKTSLSNLNKVKDDLTSDVANAKKQINEKVDLINLKETELKRVSNELINVQKELKDTNFKLLELEKLHNIEQKKNTTINNELATIKSKYNILESEAKNKNKTVNEYIAEIQKLHLDLENAKNDFKNASASNSSVSEQIHKYRSEITNLNNTIDELKKKNNSDELSDLKIKLDKAKSDVKSFATNNQIIENELKAEKERNKNLNDSLVKKIEELKNLEPKNNLKLIFGGLAFIFFLTTILFYSQYQSSERQAKNYDSELYDKTIELEELQTIIYNSNYKWYFVNANFKNSDGNSVNDNEYDSIFNYQNVKYITPKIDLIYFGDDNSKVSIGYERREPNNEFALFNDNGSQSYVVWEDFEIYNGKNELVFKSGWEAGSGVGNYVYNFFMKSPDGKFINCLNDRKKNLELTSVIDTLQVSK